MTAPRRFDPAHHDSHLVALFPDASAAEQARAAVEAAGLPPSQVTVMDDGAALRGGGAHPVQDLFVPEDDYQDYHQALTRGCAVLVARPATAEARDAAMAALEAAGPLDPEQHGRNWRDTPAPAHRFSVNHATLSRADMHNRALGGQDEVILDMTGQKMTVRTLSGGDMTAAPFARVLTAADRSPPPAPPPSRREPVRQTSYTYGVPPELVRRMSAVEQVRAQPHMVEDREIRVADERTVGNDFLRVVDGEARLGWRERSPVGSKVRSYVTERPADSAR